MATSTMFLAYEAVPAGTAVGAARPMRGDHKLNIESVEMAEGLSQSINGLQIEDMDATPPAPKITWETVGMLVLPNVVVADDARDIQMLGYHF
eukprot:scaffold570_cov95-Isochrysis_galbana.AAC.1